ncbi:hypothetical protein ACFVW1_03755 [Streptomyces olivochromogenes]|uniref:hypothetical protein n=1 Tax=Streptomyces olivochromogenes TaxID=1963 RepID=UPI0036DEAD95
MQTTGLVVSVIALLVSGVAVRYTTRIDKRDVFLKLHETLISPELQRGRRVLFDLYRRQGVVEDLSQEDYELANRALAALDVAAYYCEKKYVSEQDFLDLWAPALGRLKYAAAPFIEHRDRMFPGFPVWPHYRRLASQAESRLTSSGVAASVLSDRNL